MGFGNNLGTSFGNNLGIFSQASTNFYNPQTAYSNINYNPSSLYNSASVVRASPSVTTPTNFGTYGYSVVNQPQTSYGTGNPVIYGGNQLYPQPSYGTGNNGDYGLIPLPRTDFGNVGDYGLIPLPRTDFGNNPGITSQASTIFG